MIWTAEEIALAEAEAASWAGTPHMQRRQIKGRGVDCVHLVLAVLQSAGFVPPCRLPQYPQHLGATVRNPLPDIIGQIVDVESISMDEWEPQTGDIAIWRPISRTNHCGIVAGPHIWHVAVGAGVGYKLIKGARKRLQEALRLRRRGLLMDPETFRIR